MKEISAHNYDDTIHACIIYLAGRKQHIEHNIVQELNHYVIILYYWEEGIYNSDRSYPALQVQS